MARRLLNRLLRRPSVVDRIAPYSMKLETWQRWMLANPQADVPSCIAFDAAPGKRTRAYATELLAIADWPRRDAP